MKKKRGYTFSIKEDKEGIIINVGLLTIELMFMCDFINKYIKPKEKMTYWNIGDYMNNDFNKLPRYKRERFFDYCRSLNEM